ncbi:MAG: protease PrsW [Pseudonocardiales bacterium]|nr:protease PrsW [Pseudonocardiales bacterium]
MPLGILLATRYRANPADGLLVGVAVGTGFAVLETLGYGFVILPTTGGDLLATEGTLILRGLLSPAAHIAWTGLAAAALWHAHAQRWRPRGGRGGGDVPAGPDAAHRANQPVVLDGSDEGVGTELTSASSGNIR